MQSRVDALGVFLNHSITIRSSNSPAGTAPTAPKGFRFFGFGGAPTPSDGDGAPAESSVALRLLVGLGEVWVGLCAVGLEALLPGEPALGLVARLPAAPCKFRGLAPRFVLGFSFGALGLVARFATIECPPSPPGAGDVAREPAFDGGCGRAGVETLGVCDVARGGTCCGC